MTLHHREVGKTIELTEEELEDLARVAWLARENAHVIGPGPTPVGCALLSTSGRIYDGCNAEHQFRSHDVHAEVAAIAAMVSGGDRGIAVLVVVAERDRFMPCGACMDWIMEFGGNNCVVGFQREKDGEFMWRTAREIMPFYPQ